MNVRVAGSEYHSEDETGEFRYKPFEHPFWKNDVANGEQVDPFNARLQPNKPLVFTYESLSGQRYQTVFTPGNYLGKGPTTFIKLGKVSNGKSSKS